MNILNMKKRILYFALATIALASCRNKDQDIIEPEVSIETQNTYDDQAAQEFLKTHYFDAKGNLKDFVESDTVNVKLSDLDPVVLPSGVIYVKRPGAQPEPGTPIGSSDIIRIMSVANTYVAVKTDSKVSFTSAQYFRNTISGSGVPEVDPAYYFVKKQVLESGATEIQRQRSFYEIEGFREALQKFEAFDLPDDADYNLQGVIIVPSRAAFARDAHFDYSGISYRNRSFIFNFQVYKTTAAPDTR